MLILFRGLPATGKSTLARGLAAHLRAPVLDRDVLKSTALQQCSDDRAAAVLSYTQLRALVDDQLGLGLSVVVDAPFTQDAELEPLLAPGASLGPWCCHTQ